MIQFLTGCLLIWAFRPGSAAHLSPPSCHCSAARRSTFDPPPMCTPPRAGRVLRELEQENTSQLSEPVRSAAQEIHPNSVTERSNSSVPPRPVCSDQTVPVPRAAPGSDGTTGSVGRFCRGFIEKPLFFWGEWPLTSDPWEETLSLQQKQQFKQCVC